MKRAKKRAPRSGANHQPELLGAVLSDTRVAVAKVARASPVDGETWRRVVGARIAQKSAPGQIRRGVLTVAVSSAVWAQELTFLSREIVGRLRKTGILVDGIRFRVTPMQPPPSPPPAARRVSPAAPLPAVLEERLARIQDPELRAAIAEAASHSLATTPRASTSAPPNRRAPESGGPGSARSARSFPAAHSKPQRRR